LEYRLQPASSWLSLEDVLIKSGKTVYTKQTKVKIMVKTKVFI